MVILVDVLHLNQVRRGLIDFNITQAPTLHSTEAFEPSAEEGDESDEEPTVAEESQRKLSGIDGEGP